MLLPASASHRSTATGATVSTRKRMPGLLRYGSGCMAAAHCHDTFINLNSSAANL